MNELISLTQSAINGELQQTVNARELHGFLESKQDFSTWIKNRIEQYDFVENQDFVRFHKKMEQYDFVENQDFIKLHKKMELSKTGQMGIDYYIQLDMAKELAMGR